MIEEGRIQERGEFTLLITTPLLTPTPTLGGLAS